MKIIGIDPSLTSTGLAVIEPGKFVHTGTILGRGVGIPRMRQTRTSVGAWLGAWNQATDLAVIEGPSYNSMSGQKGHHERAGLWWLLVDMLVKRGVQYAVVPPACRARYATGKGNAGKDAVLAAVVRRYADVDVTGNDQADALVLAAMGARWLGEPIETSLPKANLTAMDAVRWPEAVTA